jgi:tRNA threonylcarbamoyladenosine biosynthesis protein TsaE
MSNIIYNLSGISEVSDYILAHSLSRLLCIRGPMGAGKTTLVKALLKKLGAAETGNSPSFGLVNEYRGPDGGLLAYHLDCYRLEGEEEALDFGIEEYLGADCRVFVEWPERIASLLPGQRTEIFLEPLSPESRKLHLVNLGM